MSDLICMTEYQDWVGDLPGEDYEFLAGELAGQVSVRREIRDSSEVCVVNPKQYVGAIALPSGLRIEIRPKIPISNLFYMLSIAFDFPWPFRDEFIRLNSFDELLAAIAKIFSDLVEHRINAGLYRSYCEQEQNASYVRGRIGVLEDLRRNAYLRHRVWCRFSEFTWDIEENQIIRQVAHLLSGWGFHNTLRLRLSRLDSALAEITPTALPGSRIERFQYGRLNEDYRQIHQLCRLFLEGSSLSEELGAWDSRTFLLDMNKFFEQFVTQILVNEASNRLTVRAQSEMALDVSGKVRIRPDLLISAYGAVVAVADCKYKRVDSDLYHNHDVYQVLSYCVVNKLARGILVYPAHECVLEDDIEVRNSSISIERCTIDLGLPLRQFRQECEGFVHRILPQFYEA